MTTMIERVARAIYETWKAAGSTTVTWEELLQMQEEDGYLAANKMYALALAEARAALEAMKEPTEAMEEAADDPVHAELKKQGQFFD